MRPHGSEEEEDVNLCQQVDRYQGAEPYSSSTRPIEWWPEVDNTPFHVEASQMVEA